MKLEEIEKLCEKATPGPWYYNRELDHVEGPSDRSIFWMDNDLDANLRFVEASRELIPKLLAVAKAAKTYMEQIQERRPEFADYKVLVDAIHALEKE